MKIDKTFGVAHMTTYFIDLGGLGVRDLTHHGDDILILAGPVSGIGGGFSILRWTPGESALVQTPTPLCEWIEAESEAAEDRRGADTIQIPAGPSEHPEAICCFKRGERDGIIVLY